MCDNCTEDRDELRHQIKVMLYQAMEEVEGNSTFDGESIRDALHYALENEGTVQYNEEERQKILELVERMDSAEGEELAGFKDEALALLAQLSMDGEEIMDLLGSRLAEATLDTVEADQTAFKVETLDERLIRGLQHLYWYHEPRPQFYQEVLGEQFCREVLDRMTTYARQAMQQLPHFNTVLLPLHEQGAVEAIATMMYTTMMEGLVAGYYAGSQGQDCFLGMLHEWGPQGNDEDETHEQMHDRIDLTIEKIRHHMGK